MRNAPNDYLHIEDNVMTILGKRKKNTAILLKIMPNVVY